MSRLYGSKLYNAIDIKSQKTLICTELGANLIFIPCNCNNEVYTATLSSPED